MEFKYTQNPSAEIPRMFIDKEISDFQADGSPGIVGSEFMKELLFLSDVLEKKNIEVWINSPGGIVTEGQSIYAGILESKAKVDTYCYGIAASISGVIFQAGRNREMADYANLMYHPPYNEGGGVDKGLEALKQAICTMIATRTGKSEEEVLKIMNAGKADDKGTWMDAQTALENGFCDKVRPSDEKNRKRISAEGALNIWKEANKIYNRLPEPTPKKKNMKKVCNKLGLNEEANEDSIVASIDVLKNEVVNKKAESDDIKKKMDELKADYEKKLADLKTQYDDLKKKNDDDDKARKAKAEDEDKAKAKDELKNAVTAGKIKNDAAIIKTWSDNFEKDFLGTKALLESIPATRKAANMIVNSEVKVEDSPYEAEARVMGIKPGSAAWYNHIKAAQIKANN